MCDGERGSGPEGADDLCSVSREALGKDMSPNIHFETAAPKEPMTYAGLEFEH